MMKVKLAFYDKTKSAKCKKRKLNQKIGVLNDQFLALSTIKYNIFKL